MTNPGQLATFLLDSYVVASFWLLVLVIAAFRVVAILRSEEHSDGA